MHFNTDLRSFNKLIQSKDLSALKELLNISYIEKDFKDPLKDLILELQTVDKIGFDVEASSLDPHSATLLLIQISTPDNIYVINAGTNEKDVLQYIINLIHERNIMCVGHNIKYDAKMIYHNFGVLFLNLFDTMLAEAIWLAGISKPFESLAKLVERYMSVLLIKDTRDSFIDKHDHEFTDEQIIYSGLDVAFLLPLENAQSTNISNRKQHKAWEVERTLEPVVALMEYDGITLDTDHWKSLAREAERDLKAIDKNINKYLLDNFDTIAGEYDNAWDVFRNMALPFYRGKSVKAKIRQAELAEITVRDEIVAAAVPEINLNSTKQVPLILQKLGLDVESSSQKALEKHKTHEFVAMLLEHRKYVKRVASFGMDFLKHINPVTGRIHAEFNQLRPATGRFSSDDPNLQNIIALQKYRKAFMSRKGYLLGTADYDQIELKAMAEIANERLMMDAFLEGRDLHALTASLIFDIPFEEVTDDQRNNFGKRMNFAVIYGTTEYGLQHNFGWPKDKGREYLDKYFEEYGKIKQFMDMAGSLVVEKAFSTTLLGRKRFFSIPSNLNLRDYRVRQKLSQIKRQGVNHIIQGTCADMIKLAIIYLFYNNPFGHDAFRILMTVHDEIVIEFKEDIKDEAEEFIRKAMVTAGERFVKEVPVTISYKEDTVWRK
jgi:DNA polymerase I-like protein with 3'-5' exonuclease and polymerase domains